jgi:hypothetical protein
VADRTADQLTAILDAEVAKYQRSGWVIQERTATTAQLMRPAKKYGGCARLAFGLFLLFAPRRDEFLFIEVAPSGKVSQRQFRR